MLTPDEVLGHAENVRRIVEAGETIPSLHELLKQIREQQPDSFPPITTPYDCGCPSYDGYACLRSDCPRSFVTVSLV